MASYSSELTDEHLTGFFSAGKIATSRHVARTHSMKAINACLLFCSILGALAGVGYLCFDPIVKHVVLRRLILTNDSDYAQLWEKPPITPHLKIYFFNLSNPEQVFAGKEKPHLTEVGPYVYHQKWIKENVRWHGNGTMSYQTRKEFTFMPELSAGHHSEDVITTLNVPLLSAYYQMRDANFMMQWGLEGVVYSLEYQPWTNKTVEELVWGYHEPLLELAKDTLPNPPAFTDFGFFNTRNISANLSTYTMYTGEGNPYRLSQINKFNGKEHLNFWQGEDADQCNKVRGSDGATWSPYIQKDDTLYFFNDQLCRSLPLVFSHEVTSNSLPGYRFVPRQDVFMTPASFPESNSCFCSVDPDLCAMLGDGMFGVSACQFGAPIVLSWPHMLGANDTFRDKLDGMRPDKEKHGFWFDVQPVTGTSLSAKARIQINMAVKRSKEFTALSEIEDTIIPLLWFEEGLDDLGPELVSAIAEAVDLPPVYKNYVLCVWIGLTLATMVIAVVAVIFSCLKRSEMRRDPDRRRRGSYGRAGHGDDVSGGDSEIGVLDARLREVKCALLKHPLPALGNVVAGVGVSVGGADSDPSVHQPMLPQGAGQDSTDSSRATTANHSRNTSTGSSNVMTTTATAVSTLSAESAQSAQSAGGVNNVNVRRPASESLADRLNTFLLGGDDDDEDADDERGGNDVTDSNVGRSSSRGGRGGRKKRIVSADNNMTTI